MARRAPGGLGSATGLFSVALGLALLVLAGFQVVDYREHAGQERTELTRLQVFANAERIRYYDELLTMSARHAAATGDRSYVDRYHAAVPHLDRVIAETLEQADDPVVTAALEATSTANRALIDLEETSFAQLAAGDRDGAYATLNSDAYRDLKQEYERGLDEFIAALHRSVGQAQRDDVAEQNLEAVLSGVLIAMLLALWAATWLGLRRTSRARDRAEAQLAMQALHDPLTGLANRVLLSQRIDLASRRRRHGVTALYCVDLDDFKQVNDEHGQHAGDLVLIEVASRLQASARAEDIVARLGGDEFAVLVEDLPDDEEVRELGQRFCAALSPAIDVEGAQAWCPGSIGYAILTDAPSGSASQPEDLLFRADSALHLAKAAGKSRVVGFEEHMHDDAAREAHLRTELREAFAEQQFTVWYQPVIDLRRGAMTGVEALVRWNHPARGCLAPGEFLPRVAGMGLMPQLTRFVLGEACRWAAERAVDRADEAPLTVAVNVSPHELRTSRIVEQITEVLGKTGLPASLLTIEVTETEALLDADIVVPHLRAVREMGVSVAIDDFGTGYSSLSHVQKLPVDLLKIDKSFVDGLAVNLEDSTVVAAVVGLAHSMELTVVAEGVETVKQLKALRELGCECVQGYLLARPAPGDALPEPAELQHRLSSFGIVDRASMPGPPKFTVLVADNVAGERSLLRGMLERTDRFEVVSEAADGVEALTGATAFRPAVVLLDFEMPGLDGMSALPLIVAAVPTTRVVILSGHVTEAMVEQARLAGAAACVEKGVADIPASLLEVLGAAS